MTEHDRWNILHQALVSVVRPPDPDGIRYLLARGVKVNARDIRGWTPLHFAARLKEPALISLLLAAGAEVDPETVDGLTPLRLTLSSRPVNREATETLLRMGANLGHELAGATVRDYLSTIAHGEEDHLLELLEYY